MKKILKCGWCNIEILKCDYCNHNFKDTYNSNESVFCLDNKNKRVFDRVAAYLHFCEECVIESDISTKHEVIK